MKIKGKIIIGLILLSSCSAPNYYQQQINDIPTQNSSFNAQIRFKEDGLPNKPYFEIIDVDICEKGRLNKTQIQKRLQIEAFKEGVDAIIDIDLWSESVQEPNLFTMLMDVLDDDLETTTFPTNYTYIRGRGIMYLENLDFIKDQPEFEYFYKIDTDTGFPTPCFKIEYKLTGQEHMVYPESDANLDIYKKYFQFYSDHHLLKQRAGWSYKMDGLLLKKRILRSENGLISKICTPKYDMNNRLVQLKLKHRNSQISSKERIRYTYDNDGIMDKRTIEASNGTIIREDYLYDNNRLAGRNIIITNQDEQISLTSSIDYYDSNYLKDYYFNNVVKQRQAAK